MDPTPSSPVAAAPENHSFGELTTLDKVVKTTLGTILFVGWVALFIFGMSLDSSKYRDYIFMGNATDFDINPGYLLLYAVSFTPTNVAVLASLAGILGGFASNLAASNQFRYLRPTSLDPQSEEFASYMYMTENPLVSMLRGFITYLIFIAGSYLTNFTSSVDPKDASNFTGLTASSYFKFAVSVSLLAYLAGYDPSRMKGLINSVSFTRKDPPAPTPHPAQETIITEQNTKTLAIATIDIPPVPNGKAIPAA